MNWTLELLPIPVTDVDRAKEFYVTRVGFGVDFDIQPSERERIVQLTPPGSGCSIAIGTNLYPLTPTPEPGSVHNVQLVVPDLDAARTELVERGVEVSEIIRLAPGDGGQFATFSDPDGNTWTLQEIRGPARE